jgi:peroxiredoxin
MGIRNNFAQQFTPTCQFLHALTMPLKYIGYTLKHMIAVNTVSVNQFVYRRWKDTDTTDMLEVIRLVYATGGAAIGHSG